MNLYTAPDPDSIERLSVEPVNARRNRQPLYAPRKKVFPKRAEGRFRRFKWIVMLVTLGAAAGSLVPLQATIRQERSPLRLLPRVVALSTASIPIAVPAAVLVTGFLIDGLGLGRASLLLTGAAILVGLAVLTSPWTRHLDRAE